MSLVVAYEVKALLEFADCLSFLFKLEGPPFGILHLYLHFLLNLEVHSFGKAVQCLFLSV